MQKYKLTWRDIRFNDFKVYFFALFKAFIPKKKIKNYDELEDFIQTKSAWVSQVTLYNYLKTRMGTRYVLHFENDEFMKSVNLAKWNIYSVALQDLTFFTFSFLKTYFKFEHSLLLRIILIGLRRPFRFLLEIGFANLTLFNMYKLAYLFMLRSAQRSE